MSRFDDLDDDAFRLQFRTFLEKYYPPQWRRPLELRLRGGDERRWLGLLHAHGWRAPGWPTAYGGLGLSFQRQLILHDELEQHRVARFIDFGGHLLGPTLIRYGSDAQRARHLPGILDGSLLWCQGYSEPNAGSDLAALSAQAVRDGDGYRLTGSKIWTTQATDADWMFLLARTGRAERKQEGITFFLLPMDAPGITIRPIVNLAGEDEFAQVFFDDVRIPASDRVHDEGRGWEVARSLLGVERITNGSPHLARQALDLLERLATARCCPNDMQVEVARLRCRLRDAQALYAEIREDAILGDVAPHRFSTMKVVASELFQQIADMLLSAAGTDGGRVGPVLVDGEPVDLHRIQMIARPTSIFSGTNEIQRNLIARAVIDRG